jgi:Protein of unknown function (DUF998)
MSSQRLAVAGVLAFAAVVLADHLLVPGLSPLEHEVSEYASSRYGALTVFGFAAWAVSLAASSVLALRALGARPAAVTLSALFALASIGLVVTACFHTQTSAGRLPAGIARTLGGELHNLGSGAALIALALAAPLSVLALPGHPRYRALTAGLMLAALASTVVLLAVGPQVAGLRQRCLLAVACVWQLALIRTLAGARGAVAPGA